VIFVDANVPMYLVGGEHPNKLDTQRVLKQLASEQRHLVTNSEVLQEIMHRYISAGRRDWIEYAFNALRAIVDDVLAVEEADVLAAKDLVLAYQQLSARDAVHAAVMRRRQITEIFSFDRGFDAVPGIQRLPRTDSA
jgi:predicted nucleic acid-binding protein